MTTLRPRDPYTDDDLRILYPAGLKLQLVQILLRHGERTPVSERFKNVSLLPLNPSAHILMIGKAGLSACTLQLHLVLTNDA